MLTPYRVPRSALQLALDKISIAIGNKKEGPGEFSNIFLSIKENLMSLTAFSSKMTAQALVSGLGTSKEPDEFVLSGTLLRDLVSSFTKDDVIFEPNDISSIFLKCGRSKYKLNLISKTTLPKVPSYNDGNMKTFNLKEFLGALSRVSYCSSIRNDRPYLQSVCINRKHIVASDGMRLALVPNEVVELEGSILLPIESVNRLIKLFATKEEKGLGYEITSHIEITENTCNIISQDGGVTVASSSRLLVGSYPNYEKIIPSDNYTVCTMQRVELQEALSRALLISDGSKKVRFSFSPGTAKISIDANRGVATEVVECMIDTQQDITVNGDFILSILKKLTDDVVNLELRGPDRLLVIRERGFINVTVSYRS